MIPLIAIALSLVLGCRAGHRGVVEAPPAWQSEQGRVDARIDMADALVRGGNAEKALEMVRQMRTEGIREPRLDVVQARALREIGLTDDAESLLVDLVKHHPREAAAWNQLGILCLDDQRVDQAVVHLERARRLAPEDPQILNNLGFALLAAQQPGPAIDVLREALRLDGADRQIRNNLGFALVADRREDEALRVFRAGLAEPDARYNLGLGLELRGDEAAAVDAYVQVLRQWPMHKPALDGLRRLRPGELHRISPLSPDAPQEAP
ncbi:tetratricopeptide repeat protein [Myxococcota bacterium]|nr:tetratricopeptide repeat protein [Myxococcota bacterium]